MALFTFTPDMPDDPLRRFRTLAQYIAGRNPQAPLKSILAVGAVHDNGDLSPRDQAWLTHALALCNDKQISVASDFTLTVMNLHYGDDFLAHNQNVKADLVMICYVIDPDSREARYVPHYFQECPGLLTSPRHGDENWNKAIANTGAKLVVAFSRSALEVSRRNLSPPHLHHLGTLTVQASSLHHGGAIRYTMDALAHPELIPTRQPASASGFVSLLQGAKHLLGLS